MEYEEAASYTVEQMRHLLASLVHAMCETTDVRVVKACMKKILEDEDFWILIEHLAPEVGRVKQDFMQMNPKR